MKKNLFVAIACMFFAICASGQSRDIKFETASDYSNIWWPYDDYATKLKGVGSNENYTGLFFEIIIMNNKEGSFVCDKSFYISGPFGKLHPIAMTINGEEWKLGETYYYSAGNKKHSAKVILFFKRIPAGVSKINYCNPNRITWNDIPVDGNPDPVVHSKWTEQSLREHWDANGCSTVEGIYYFTTTSDKNWWGPNKHTLAVIKDGYQYNIIYLKGSNKNIWNEGDVKATFVASAVPGLYKVTSWFMENKLENEDFYAEFTQETMSVYEKNSDITADFLKLYPANDINLND